METGLKPRDYVDITMMGDSIVLSDVEIHLKTMFDHFKLPSSLFWNLGNRTYGEVTHRILGGCHSKIGEAIRPFMGAVIRMCPQFRSQPQIAKRLIVMCAAIEALRGPYLDFRNDKLTPVGAEA